MDELDWCVCILFSLHVVVIVISCALWSIYRKASYITHRSVMVTSFCTLALLALCYTFVFKVMPVDGYTCFIETIIIKFVVPNPPLCWAVKCFRILTIYDMQMEAITPVKVNNNHISHVWKRSKWPKLLRTIWPPPLHRIRDSYLICVVFFWHTIQAIFALAGIIQAAVAGDSMLESCASVPLRTGFWMTMAVFFAVLGYFAFRLRAVHDAYYIKRELNHTLVVTVVLFLPSYGMTYWRPRLAYVLLSAAGIVLQSMGILIPGVLAAREVREERFWSSDECKPSRLKEKKEHDTASFELIIDDNSYNYIRYYLTDRHLSLTYGPYMLCWRDIHRFLEQPSPALALAIEQYYLHDCERSPRSLSRLKEEERSIIAGIVARLQHLYNDNIDPEQLSIEEDIFDNLIPILRRVIGEVLPHYMASEVYKRYRDENGLEMGLTSLRDV